MINIKNLNISTNISLANFTTLKVGGTAEYFSQPRNISELIHLIKWSKRYKIPCRAIGAGSNLLINDTEVEGLTICTRKLKGNKINSETGSIRAVCGESLPSLSRKAANAGLHGFEWAIGIPATVGGAVVMNAGAQGGCIADRTISIEVISPKEGKTFVLEKNEINFKYRSSIFQSSELIVLAANFQLMTGFNQKDINEDTSRRLLRRKNSQPYHLPSCGSIFKNPKDSKAAELIDQLGLKGQKVGGAEISTMHANFIVNTKNATATDIKKLIMLIQKKVKEKHGFLLHTEVKEIGF